MGRIRREAMKELHFTVPLTPPSVNHYAKHTRSGRHYVTKEGKAFKAAVALFARGQRIVARRYEVHLKVYFAAKQKGDVDNLPKCVLDGLTEAGTIDSDAKVYKLTVEKDRDPGNPRTEITILG